MNFKNIKTVAKKELKSYFTDKIILAQMILIPFIFVYGFGMFQVSAVSPRNDDDELYIAYSVDAPDFMQSDLEKIGVKPTERANIEKHTEEIKNKECELILVFPEDFSISEKKDGKLPNVEMIYSTERRRCIKAFAAVSACLESYQPRIFTINADPDAEYDLADEEKAARKTLGMMIPVMVFTSVFMVCMMLAAESIAGDKERGFLNMLLVTPANRKDIAAGKAISIFTVAVVGGISAFTGMVLGLPALSDSMMLTGEISYTPLEYLVLFVLTMSAIFVFTSIILLISTVSKTVKQAATISPLFMSLLLILSVCSMIDSFSEGVDKIGMVNNIIPVWNSMVLMRRVMELDYTVGSVIIACVFNAIFTAVMIVIIGNCFKKEKIVNG